MCYIIHLKSRICNIIIKLEEFKRLDTFMQINSTINELIIFKGYLSIEFQIYKTQ